VRIGANVLSAAPRLTVEIPLLAPFRQKPGAARDLTRGSARQVPIVAGHAGTGRAGVDIATIVRSTPHSLRSAGQPFTAYLRQRRRIQLPINTEMTSVRIGAALNDSSRIKAFPHLFIIFRRIEIE